MGVGAVSRKTEQHRVAPVVERQSRSMGCPDLSTHTPNTLPVSTGVFWGSKKSSLVWRQRGNEGDEQAL